MASKKTAVIEHLYDALSAQSRDTATLDEVRDAIVAVYGSRTGLSTRNASNFMKDLIRPSSASKNWPSRLTAKGITGRQVTGQGRCFQFIPFKPGQTEPFPDPHKPRLGMQPTVLQSVSLPRATKSLGRMDESWLIQVAVNLRIIEQHFATKSALKVLEVTHLQVAVKLGGASEIDSLFLAVVERNDAELVNALVTCEAKQKKDRILDDQIVQQVVAAYKSVQRRGLDIGLIVPIAIKAMADGMIYVVEFEPWTPEMAQADEDSLSDLTVSSTGLYELRPPVPGIGKPAKKKAAKQAAGKVVKKASKKASKKAAKKAAKKVAKKVAKTHTTALPTKQAPPKNKRPIGDDEAWKFRKEPSTP